jgi:hypothetical protein
VGSIDINPNWPPKTGRSVSIRLGDGTRQEKNRVDPIRSGFADAEKKSRNRAAR